MYKYVQKDLNTLSKKHLDFYYNKILEQSPYGVIAKNMYVHIQIDENIDFLNIETGKSIVAGQNEDGTEITYQTEEAIVLNNTNISELRTLFLSRNNYFEYNSRHKLVTVSYTHLTLPTNREV